MSANQVEASKRQISGLEIRLKKLETFNGLLDGQYRRAVNKFKTDLNKYKGSEIQVICGRLRMVEEMMASRLEQSNGNRYEDKAKASGRDKPKSSAERLEEARSLLTRMQEAVNESAMDKYQNLLLEWNKHSSINRSILRNRYQEMKLAIKYFGYLDEAFAALPNLATVKEKRTLYDEYGLETIRQTFARITEATPYYDRVQIALRRIQEWAKSFEVRPYQALRTGITALSAQGFSVRDRFLLVRIDHMRTQYDEAVSRQELTLSEQQQIMPLLARIESNPVVQGKRARQRAKEAKSREVSPRVDGDTLLRTLKKDFQELQSCVIQERWTDFASASSQFYISQAAVHREGVSSNITETEIKVLNVVKAAFLTASNNLIFVEQAKKNRSKPSARVLHAKLNIAKTEIQKVSEKLGDTPSFRAYEQRALALIQGLEEAQRQLPLFRNADASRENATSTPFARTSVRPREGQNSPSLSPRERSPAPPAPKKAKHGTEAYNSRQQSPPVPWQGSPRAAPSGGANNQTLQMNRKQSAETGAIAYDSTSSQRSPPSERPPRQPRAPSQDPICNDPDHLYCLC